MSEARQLFMEVSLAAQKQSFSEVEALNTFRGPQGPRGEPGGIDNLVINGKESVPVDGKNTINLTPADLGALGKNETAANANALNGKSAEYYATAESVDQLSQQKVDRANVVNNFTTTEAGFVADARAVRTLNDKISDAIREIIFHPGYRVVITFGSYKTSALIFSAQDKSTADAYLYSNGYLSPFATRGKFTAQLSADYKTITITNPVDSEIFTRISVLHLGTEMMSIQLEKVS